MIISLYQIVNEKLWQVRLWGHTFKIRFSDSCQRNLLHPKIKNLPSPLFAKEGLYPSLWKREVRRDLMRIFREPFVEVNQGIEKLFFTTSALLNYLSS